jgi:hypothetical protein
MRAAWYYFSRNGRDRWIFLSTRLCARRSYYRWQISTAAWIAPTAAPVALFGSWFLRHGPPPKGRPANKTDRSKLFWLRGQPVYFAACWSIASARSYRRRDVSGSPISAAKPALDNLVLYFDQRFDGFDHGSKSKGFTAKTKSKERPPTERPLLCSAYFCFAMTDLLGPSAGQSVPLDRDVFPCVFKVAVRHFSC